jgi:putative membrane protein
MNTAGMGLAMLIFWVVVLLIVVFIVWTLLGRAGSGSSNAQENALDVLRKRYARGEISAEEFEHKRKELE